MPMLLQQANLQMLVIKNLHVLLNRIFIALEDNAIDIEALRNHATNTTKHYLMKGLDKRANQTFARRVPRK
jgi:hypothetical protein